MKRIYYFGAAILVTFAASWFVFVQIYKPSDSAFLETATSHYFKHMSEAGFGEFASYDDCRLDQGDQNDRQQGVSMFGLCQTENENMDFHYMIAMSPTASFVYSDLEEISK